MIAVIMTGICAAGVLFLLRFLIALCQESEPGTAIHLLRATPRTNGDEPDAASGEEAAKLGYSHAVRSRRRRHTPAATTAWSEMEIAARPKAKRHAAD